MIRELTFDDMDDIIQVSKAKDPEGVSELLVGHFLTQAKIKMLGYFENDELVTWVALRFGDLHGEKTWCILHMFTRNLKGFFKFGEDFGQIIAKAFELAEGSGFYNYVYMVNKKHENAYYRMWKTNKYLPPSNRYEAEDICTVPAGQLAPEYWMTKIMGGVKDYDCVIKIRKLKPEFRNALI